MIERPIETCIAYAADAERPFQQVADVLVVMRLSPDWSEAELLEVQSRVLMQLIKQAAARDREPE